MVDERAGRLFAAWCADERPEVRRLLEGMPEPGPIELRCRYRHLLDGEAPLPRATGLTEDQWLKTLELEARGDRALVQTPVAADAPFEALLEMEHLPELRVVTVNALTGLGEAARQREDEVRAIECLEKAIAVAGTDGYRFGEARALLSLGYLELFTRSAGVGADRFRRALALARGVGDGLLQANATLGLAECLHRLKETEEAVQVAETALRAFESIGSSVGSGNAHERLAMMYRLQGRLPAAASALEAAQNCFAEAGVVQGQVNALDSLGELRLLQDDLAAATEAYQQGHELANENGLRRGAANTLVGLAKVTARGEDWAKAQEAHQRAAQACRDIEDLAGLTEALDSLAGTAERLVGGPAELAVRIAAVTDVERIRAASRDSSVQSEYHQRAGSTYRTALRASVRERDAAATVFMLETLAGRRLAGLLDVPVQPGLGTDEAVAHLLALADQRLVHRGQLAATPRRERIARLLGASAIRLGLAQQAVADLENSAAAFYLPLDPAEARGLLDAVPPGADVVLVAVDQSGPGRVTWLWRTRDGELDIADEPGTRELADLLTQLHRPEAAAELRLTDLEPLAQLLPEPLRRRTVREADGDVVIVPIGRLWRVPWLAVPLPDGRVLGELTRVVVSPSLTVHRAVLTRRSTGSSDAFGWRNPSLDFHDLRALSGSARWLRFTEVAAVRDRLLRTSTGSLLVVGHGRTVDALPYLELAPGEVIPLTDLLGARPPERLLLICCWGAVGPEELRADPLSFASLSLVAGSREVLTTVGELADSPAASMVVDKIVHRLSSMPLTDAVRDAIASTLRLPGLATEPVVHWAPLVVAGAYAGEGDAADGLDRG